MDAVKKLRLMLESPEMKALRQRCEDLEVRCAQLYGENEDLHKAVDNPQLVKKLREEVKSLAVALESVLQIFRYEAVGVEQIALLRTARAVLEFVRSSDTSGTTSSESNPGTTSGSAERRGSSSGSGST